MKIKDIKYIPERPALLVGKGCSANSFVKIDNYDIVTIGSSIKLFKNVKFAFVSHLGIIHIIEELNKSEYVIIPEDIRVKEINKHLKILNNIYEYERVRHSDLFEFPEDDNKLLCDIGTIFPAINFLFRLGYKEIKYIGFDGGKKYADGIDDNRKISKAINASINYDQQWEIINKYIEKYKIDFNIMEGTLNRRHLIAREKEKYNILHGENPKYGARTGRLKRFRMAEDKLHDRTKKALHLSDHLLDVGCGKGFWIDYFSKTFGMAVVGLDISEECQKFRPDLKMIIASADDIPVGDRAFDFVNFMDGLEHIPEEIEEKVMDECYRVCNKYMYFNIAIHSVGHHDKMFEEKGLGAVHINLKSVEEWKNVFIKYVEKHNIKDWIFTADEYWVMVYLEI